LGAAQFVWYQLLNHPRAVQSIDSQSGSLLGPSYTTDQIVEFLTTANAKYEKYTNEDELIHRVADLLAEEKVVGWFRGRMEYGPRALGARSIIGDARSPKMQSVMNLKIKYRESFRPFAPIVMREKASEWFEIDPQHDSPYMLIVAPVVQARRTSLTEEQKLTLQQSADLCERVNIPRSEVPSITHVDYSARLQTVDNVRNPRLHALLNRHLESTGCPVLVNTSFNVRGEPIVCTPADAFRCFLATEMDVLVLENCILLKTENQTDQAPEEREKYFAQFGLD
jgi:carbamoyltransferase